MFSRLLVPLDGSRLAESVLPVVERLAAVAPCTIVLLHIIEKNAPGSVHGDTHLRHAKQAEIYVAGVSDRLRAADLKVETHVHTVPQGDIPKCISEHALELERDLIVLCSHGSGGMRRFVFGSNAEQVLTHGVTPVLLVQASKQGSARPFGPERILVLVDNTPATEPALAIGSQLAFASGAEIRLVAVVPTVRSMSAEEAATGRLMPRAAREVLELAAGEKAVFLDDEVGKLLAVPIRAKGSLERGDTASAVVSVAKRTKADLVILAVRGLAGLSAFWANALTRKVAGSYDGVLLLIPVAGV